MSGKVFPFDMKRFQNFQPKIWAKWKASQVVPVHVQPYLCPDYIYFNILSIINQMSCRSKSCLIAHGWDVHDLLPYSSFINRGEHNLPPVPGSRNKHGLWDPDTTATHGRQLSMKCNLTVTNSPTSCFLGKGESIAGKEWPPQKSHKLFGR